MADRRPGRDHRLAWQPRIQTVLPAAAVGLVLVSLGLAALAGLLPVPDATTLFVAVMGVASVLVGLSTMVGSYLQVTHTDYVVTDRGLYRKRGVLSRTVTAVGYETVQNATYSQGITGTFFGYGTLSFDTAGGTGTELSFRDVDDPATVQRLVSDQLARVRRRSGDRELPGSVEQWEAVLDEVTALRQALESRQG
ncbi:PH domain-containing protein [Halobacteriaceae archaeon GCM10025711]